MYFIIERYYDHIKNPEAFDYSFKVLGFYINSTDKNIDFPKSRNCESLGIDFFKDYNYRTDLIQVYINNTNDLIQYEKADFYLRDIVKVCKEYLLKEKLNVLIDE